MEMNSEVSYPPTVNSSTHICTEYRRTCYDTINYIVQQANINTVFLVSTYIHRKWFVCKESSTVPVVGTIEIFNFLRIVKTARDPGTRYWEVKKHEIFMVFSGAVFLTDT